MSTRILLLPGGTSIGSVALAHAGLHKIVELYEERLADPNHPAPHTVAVLRDPALVPPATLRGAAITPSEAFPDLAKQINDDPHFFDGIDMVVETSGSTTGTPQRVGLSIDAIIASIDTTHAALDGPGAWILALPAHHIAGAMVLLRSTRHDFPPRIVDTSAGFRPEALLPAIRGALSTGGPAYLSLVPAQLDACLSHDEVTSALASLNAIMVGGQAVGEDLLQRGKAAGLRLHTSYGMSETCGGIAYDGTPLPGVTLRILNPNEHGIGRVAIHSPTLMTRYLDGPAPWVTADGNPWAGEGRRYLQTNDLGSLTTPDATLVTTNTPDTPCVLRIHGRADDVLISGGKNITPTEVEAALMTLPDVNQACVVGLAHPIWGHTLAALIVPTPNAGHGTGMVAAQTETIAPDEDTATRICAQVASTIGKHATPRVLALTDTLPTRSIGKPDRHHARTLLETALHDGTAWVR